MRWMVTAMGPTWFSMCSLLFSLSHASNVRSLCRTPVKLWPFLFPRIAEVYVRALCSTCPLTMDLCGLQPTSLPVTPDSFLMPPLSLPNHLCTCVYATVRSLRLLPASNLRWHLNTCLLVTSVIFSRCTQSTFFTEWCQCACLVVIEEETHIDRDVLWHVGLQATKELHQAT